MIYGWHCQSREMRSRMRNKLMHTQPTVDPMSLVAVVSLFIFVFFPDGDNDDASISER